MQEKPKAIPKKELAEILGITMRQYQNWEAGTSGGRITTWEKASKVLETPIDFLLKDIRERCNEISYPVVTA
jgi:transcriptional regulator with XRE-family HTH domain